MTIVLHIVQGLFAAMAAGLFLGFTQSKRLGLLLASLIYVSGASASLTLDAWWPLIVTFAGAWGLRFLGFDPSHN